MDRNECGQGRQRTKLRKENTKAGSFLVWEAAREISPTEGQEVSAGLKPQVPPC